MDQQKNVTSPLRPCTDSSDCCVPAMGSARRVASVLARVGSFLCAVLALFAGGCGAPQGLTEIKDEADFKLQVMEARQPVLVDFYKGGCPTCVLLNGTMNSLAEEYQGRVFFARFEIMKPYFAVTSPLLKARYDISFFPTAILFVNGEEKHRWSLDYGIGDYRKVLDQTLAAQEKEGSKVVASPAPKP